MIDLGIIERMNGIFENVMQSNQEWCTDHLLEIINEILHMASEIKKSDGSQEHLIPQVVFDSFLINFEYFIVLLSASDQVSSITHIF